ncbi:cytochrome P450 4g15-like [Planococcus citri]|uniref:cytochrome P450 4g15-like n=1 Tax=Planococcus citri TaxID=170843 RepID=UPI0031F96BB4
MNILIIVSCLIIITILLKIIEIKKNKRLYKLLKQFPSYFAYPLIGNLNLLYGPVDDLLARIEKLMQPHERLLFWLGPIPCLFVKKYDDIMTILTLSQDRDTLELGNEWSGMGIINARYHEWKKSRRMLAPAFTSQMLSKYVNVFNKKSSNLVEKLKAVADSGKVVDIRDYIVNANLDIIIENTVGISIHGSGKIGQIFCDALLEALRGLPERFISFWLQFGMIHSLYLKITGKSDTIKQLRFLPTKVVKRDLYDFQNQTDKFNDAEASKTIIDLLIKGSQQEPTFTETRITDELLHVIGAGAETTALNVSFLMMMLATHQDIQQKIFEEISQLLGEDEELTAEHLTDHLKYLEQCIKETSRMFSPVAVTSRRTHREYLLSDNTIVPANMFVLVFIHLVHYDNKLYKNPSKWDPEHFSEQAIAERPKGSSQLTFGYGPRSCIGAKYALMSAKTQMVHILRNYHLSTDVEDFSIKNCSIDLCIRSKIGYPVKFTRRRSQNDDC